MTSDRPSPEQVLQSILQNVQVGGSLTTGDISQILNLFISINPPESFNPTGIPQNIPSSGTIKFVGRSEELERLHQMLQQNNQVVIAAIAGMGGVGKTELATQYALLHLLLLTYPGGICWLRAREEDIGFQVVQFAQTELGLKPPEDLDLPKQVRWCWRRWREGNVLVVLDDVNDYLKVEPYLPPQPSQFKVLITTRLQLDLPQSLTLDVLGEVAALDLLQQWVEAETINQHLIDAKELCQRLGYLPLALNLVGRYIKKRKISLPEMLRRLEGKGLQHKALDVDQYDRAWTLNVNRGVAAAFELSWEELSEEAQQLGCLLSLFALGLIPWDLVESVAIEQDSEYLEDARVELESLHLLQGKETYRLHQLIREFFSAKGEQLAEEYNLKRRFCQAMATVAKKIPQTPTLEDIAVVNCAIPHLAEAATTQQDWLKDEDLIAPFLGLVHFYYGQGAYQQAISWCEQSLSTTRNRLGEEHPDVAQSLNKLAVLYYFQGRYDEAEPLYVQALALRKRLLGEDHPDVAESLNDLALLYDAQGRYDQAESLYVQALALWKQRLGEEHPDVAQILNNLAMLYDSQGRYDEAEPVYFQALALRKRLLGEEHPLVADSLNNLASLYKSQGRYDEAEPFHIQALALYKQQLGEEHPDVALSLNNLADLYNAQGRYDEAESLFVQALALRKRLLGKEHPLVAQTLNNLAALYYFQGRYDEAEPLFIQALVLRKQLLGEEHVDIAEGLNNLATLYKSQGKYDEAEPLYVQAFEIAERTLGTNHPNTIRIDKNLQKLRDERTS